MKRAMLGFAMLVGAGAASSADAADIYGKGSLKDGPVAYMPAITWTGFYFGGHVGAAFFDQDGKKGGKKHCYEQGQPVPLTQPITSVNTGQNCDQESDLSEKSGGGRYDNDSDGLDDISWLAGLHLGYNWQRSNGLVLGIEGDVSFADDIDYLASVRGRLGYAHGSTLLYGTAGAAFIGLDDAFGDDDSSTGWVAGLGIEQKLRENVSIGLEGLYYSFDDLDSHDDELEFWTVRARLTYHFTDSHSDPLK